MWLVNIHMYYTTTKNRIIYICILIAKHHIQRARKSSSCLMLFNIEGFLQSSTQAHENATTPLIQA